MGILTSAQYRKKSGKIFQVLKELEKPPPPLTCAPRSKWMSAISLRLIDERSHHCCLADHNWNVERTLTKAVRKPLTVDIHRRVESAAEEVGVCLETPKGTESYI